MKCKNCSHDDDWHGGAEDHQCRFGTCDCQCLQSEVLLQDRQYFCPNCNSLQDVFENQDDLVCKNCAWVIASFVDF